MKNRKGEKIGWIGGWLGSFSWVLLLAVIFIVQGRGTQGYYGFALFLIAAFLMMTLSPWRNPGTSYWQLLVPFYLLFIASVVWLIRSLGPQAMEWFRWWNILPLLPILIPLVILGKKKWEDG